MTQICTYIPTLHNTYVVCSFLLTYLTFVTLAKEYSCVIAYMIIFFFLGGTTIFITPYIRGLNTLETGNQLFVSNDFSYKFSDFEFSQRLKVEKYLVES